ncbi:cation-translocating P-type ATPase, partial [Candidatus Woesearchaeota archaeon]
MKKVELSISGMHCASCATLITRALKKTEGVRDANVNYATAKATVLLEDESVDENKLIEVVRNKGYDASLAEKHRNLEMEQRKEIQNFKFRFFTSVAFAIPTFILGMVFMWIGIEVPYQDYILWALATPVQFFVGWPFYKGTWTALKNKSANMDSLIAIGT